MLNSRNFIRLIYPLMLCIALTACKAKRENVTPEIKDDKKEFPQNLTPDVGFSVHSANGRKVIVSPTRKYIFVGALTSVLIFDEKLNLIRTFEVSDEGTVNSLCLTPDGKKIVIGSTNLKIFDFSSQKNLTSISSENQILSVICLQEHILFLEEDSSKLEIIRTDGQRFSYEEEDIISSIFTPMDRYLIVGNMSNLVRVMKISGSEVYEEISVELDDYALSIGGYENKYAVASFDGFVKLFDISGAILMSENIEETLGDLPISVAMFREDIALSGELGGLYIFKNGNYSGSVYISDNPIEINASVDRIFAYDTEEFVLWIYNWNLELERKINLNEIIKFQNK